MMNLSHTLDPQIAQFLAELPSRLQLLQYITGQASPVLSEIIEAHMQRSPGVRQNVEFLLRELEPETFCEDTYHRLRRLIQRNKDTDAPLHMRPGLDDLSGYFAEMAPLFRDELIGAQMQGSSEVRMDVEALLESDSEFDKALEESLKQLGSEAASARIGSSARDFHELALAGSSSKERPELRFLKDFPSIPAGIGGTASASSEAPSLCSTLRITHESPASQEPHRIRVSWPGGERYSLKWSWVESRQKWQTDVVVPESWSKVSCWIVDGKVTISM
jgi:hypothetical protein